MSHVFISYSKVDGDIAEALARDLSAFGIDVWWDHQLYAGDDFHDAILAALDRCKVAIVIWSTTAVRSRWVRDEADRAANKHKLITTHVPTFDLDLLPLGHGTLQSVDVTDRTRVYQALARRGVTPSNRLATQPQKRQPKTTLRRLLHTARQTPPNVDFRDLVDLNALGDSVGRSTAEALMLRVQAGTIRDEPAAVHRHMQPEFEEMRVRYRHNKHFRQSLKEYLLNFERDFNANRKGQRISDYLIGSRLGRAYLFLIHVARRYPIGHAR